jgi:hypothetical protein
MVGWQQEDFQYWPYTLLLIAILFLFHPFLQLFHYMRHKLYHPTFSTKIAIWFA